MTTKDAMPAAGRDRPAGGGTAAGPGTTRDSPASWADRAADRSPSVQRSRTRSVRQVKGIVDAARRLIHTKGSSFTTQELAKEAGIALQTFYRHFAGKDQLLLAVFEEELTTAAVRIDAAISRLPDPVARLRFFITSTLESLGEPGGSAAYDQDGDAADAQDARGPQGVRGGGFGPRFVTAEHWRLHQLFPDEMAQVSQPIADLIERELREAASLGLLRPRDPASDAWFVMNLVMSVYHHYAFATPQERFEDIADHLWVFCLAALRGDPDEAPLRETPP
ncbi:TetR/AcrR family transcriptional regulator [Spirillospora sp. CA-255316]